MLLHFFFPYILGGVYILVNSDNTLKKGETTLCFELGQFSKLGNQEIFLGSDAFSKQEFLCLKICFWAPYLVEYVEKLG